LVSWLSREMHSFAQRNDNTCRKNKMHCMRSSNLMLCMFVARLRNPQLGSGIACGTCSSTWRKGPLYLPVWPANEQVTLQRKQTNWTVKFQNGEQRTFDATTGKLLTISDRNGNTA